MPLTFYPYTEDAQKGSLNDRIEVLMEAAERYKAVVLDESSKVVHSDTSKRLVPRDMKAAYNWEEITRVLREIRDLPEANKIEKTRKGDLLAKLAEVYEVLRAAKMSKLEAVRLALISESNQLRGAASQVA
jgi:hypothetical protein